MSDEEQHEQCRCGGEGDEPHECPFANEIHNSGELCNCCKDCTHQCAMDI
jgi:hypothetical protein